MNYKVKRRLGYEPWGVTNPWVFADFGQPQRRRVMSNYIFQTHPPQYGIHHLGQIPLLSEAEARATRMERYAILGLTLSTISLGFFIYRFRK